MTKNCLQVYLQTGVTTIVVCFIYRASLLFCTTYPGTHLNPDLKRTKF